MTDHFNKESRCAAESRIPSCSVLLKQRFQLAQDNTRRDDFPLEFICFLRRVYEMWNLCRYGFRQMDGSAYEPDDCKWFGHGDQSDELAVE
jgi:hypothetical protein